MYKTLHKKQGSVTVQLRFARSSVTFCAKRDNIHSTTLIKINKKEVDHMKGIICIGRQYGSGGREVGEKLARKLGIPCYDKLLIKKAALESGLSTDFISKTEESPINSIQFLSGNPYADIASIGNTFYSESQVTFNAEKEVIEKIAKQGPCVIIGRCAASMIPKENRLSVFIYSDKESTVKRVMKRNQISEKEAVHRIKHMNRMRKHFYEFYSETEWGQSESYDMMLSSSKLGIDGCVDVIIDGLRGMGEMENE